MMKKQKDCTTDESGIKPDKLETFKEIQDFASEIAKDHNISNYTIKVLIYQDGTRSVAIKSFIENYKITIEPTPPYDL